MYAAFLHTLWISQKYDLGLETLEFVAYDKNQIFFYSNLIIGHPHVFF